MVTFAVIGGDVRQLRLGEMLQSDGNRVNLAAFEKQPEYGGRCMSYQAAIKVSDCVILPAPSFSNGYIAAALSDEKISKAQLLNSFEPGMTIIGGRLDEEFMAAAREKGCHITDILERDDFVTANAVPAAEGAIQIAMEQLPITIAGSKCLITGAGRIGKQLAIRLRSLGAEVTVTARRSADIAFCEALGVAAEDTARLGCLVPGNDVIFNMIPQTLFTAAVLERVPRDCLCIDLASVPGGFDRQAAERRGIKVIHALSLPGKVAPVTSARNLKKVIGRILENPCQ